MYSRMYMEKDYCLLHYYACAAAVLLLIATPPSPPRTTPLFSNTTLFVICYALCAAYLSASAAEILSVCAVLIAAGCYNIQPRYRRHNAGRQYPAHMRQGLRRMPRFRIPLLSRPPRQGHRRRYSHSFRHGRMRCGHDSLYGSAYAARNIARPSLSPCGNSGRLLTR